MKTANGTIRDVARETGLSVATVSRVMNGAANVSDATRTRVLETSKRLNYMPNPAARALTTRRSRTIAAVVPTLEHSIFAKFLAAVDSVLTERGYSLVIASSHFDKDEEERATTKLLGMGAEAFVFSGLDHNAGLLDMLDARAIPHVFTSCWSDDADGPVIGYDNSAMAELAIAYLASCGHRRVALIHGPVHNNDRTRARLDGANKRARELGIDVEGFEAEISVAGGVDAARRIMAKGKDRTAVLCFSDVLAMGAIIALQSHGLRVPEDVSVMGFDNLDWAASFDPPLTTIDLPTVEMGRTASAAIIGRLDDGEELASVRLDGQIVKRGSVAPPRGA